MRQLRREKFWCGCLEMCFIKYISPLADAELRKNILYVLLFYQSFDTVTLAEYSPFYVLAYEDYISFPESWKKASNSWTQGNMLYYRSSEQQVVNFEV